MDALEALLMPVPEDERMKALARSLRGRQVAADFFAGSTVPGLQRMAQGEQEYIKDVAERQGVLREAMERRKQDQSQHEDSVRMREQQLQQSKEYQDAIVGIRNDLAKAKATEGTTAKPLKPTSKMVTDQLEGIEMLNVIGNLNSMYGGMDDAQRSQVDQPMAEIGVSAADFMLPEGIARVVEEKAYSDPSVREYRAQGRRWEQRLSNLAAGLSLTGYEIKARQKWSPFATGISQDERQVRMDVLKDELGRTLNNRASMFPGYLPVPEAQEVPEQSAPENEMDFSSMSDEELEAIANGNP